MVIWFGNHLFLHVCHPRCLCVRCCSLNTDMIDSRCVLSSFDYDGAQFRLTSQMESWQRTNAATQPERPAKVRRNSNATAAGGKDDLERQLLVICARLGLRNARDISLLNSICCSTVKLPKYHAVCVAAAEARRAHATHTRGNVFSTPPESTRPHWTERNQRLHRRTSTQRQETGGRSPLLSSARSMERNTREILFPPQPCAQHVRNKYHDGEQSGGDKLYGPTWQPRTESP